MEIKKDFDLSSLNTFGIKVKAKYFIQIENENQIKDVFSCLEFKENERLFLGGGSNILFTKDFSGIVVANRLKGIEILEEDSSTVLLRAMGGEVWHDVVLFSVSHGFWGMENLSLIPGTVGAGPVQNIGAYGVELKDIVERVEAYNIENGEKKIFSNDECEFGYRDSVFKTKFKNKYFISGVVFRLSKIQNKNVNYKALTNYLEENNLEITNSKDVSDAVSNIRMSKLPDPKVLGNAGSFFKNVYVDEKKFQELKKVYIDIPSFNENRLVKIPTGWLIEKCGWKGKRVGNVGVYEKQSLVLVNYGGASGEEIKNLCDQIIKDVYDKFGLQIQAEVNLF